MLSVMAVLCCLISCFVSSVLRSSIDVFDEMHTLPVKVHIHWETCIFCCSSNLWLWPIQTFMWSYICLLEKLKCVILQLYKYYCTARSPKKNLLIKKALGYHRKTDSACLSKLKKTVYKISNLLLLLKYITNSCFKKIPSITITI